MDKYKLTEKKITFEGVELFQIQALKDFPGVGKGDFGGWVEKEENLSQTGSSWVHEDVKIYGEVRVGGNTQISEGPDTRDITRPSSVHPLFSKGTGKEQTPLPSNIENDRLLKIRRIADSKQQVEDILKKGADFFESRREEYGEEYLKTGKIRKAFFPNGIKLETEDDFYFFHLFDMVCMKLSRIAEHWENGQHEDSWNDIMIYAAMSLERIKND